ncbi:hypothetical protein ACHAQC_009906 [Fusarium culmorum]
MSTRYNVTLDTGTPADGADNRGFDQVTALSQGVINASFQQLFKSVEGVNEIAYVSRLQGRFEAVIDAPSIMINGATTNATEIMYIFRIKSGKFLFIDGVERKIYDWALAIPTKVNEVSYEETAGDTPEAARRKKRWRKELQDKYPGFVPGDYSVQRIFCALGSAGWYKPDEDSSTVWDPVAQQTISYKVWLNREENKLYKDIIPGLLSGWATKEGEDAVATMGIKFNLSQKRIQAGAPTFRPVHIFNQVYPYLTSDQDRGTMSLGRYTDDYVNPSNPYGKLTPGDYNCLLYCEQVDRPTGKKTTIFENGRSKIVDEVAARNLPKNLKLGHSGNLAEPGIVGSYVIHHRIFLLDFLLPQLQELCMATFVQVGKPDRRWDTSTNWPNFWSNRSIGCELEGQPAREASDSIFKFEHKSDSKGDYYMWSKKSEANGLNDIYAYKYPDSDRICMYNNYNIWADSSVEVRWVAGSDRLEVTGKVYHETYIAYSYLPEVKTDLQRKHTKYTASWSFAIVLKTVERTAKVDDKEVKFMALEAVIEGINKSTNVPLNTSVDCISVLDETPERGSKQWMLDKLSKMISTGIGIVSANLEKRFRNSGKYNYPGYGELEFTDPKFTSVGNIITKVNFKPPSHSDGKMYFPAVNPKDHVLVPPSKPDPDTSTFQEGLKHTGELSLDWHQTLNYNKDTGIGRLTFTVSNRNKLKKDLAYGFIRISLEYTPNKLVDGRVKDATLFGPDDWEKDQKAVVPEPDEKKDTVPEPVGEVPKETTKTETVSSQPDADTTVSSGSVQSPPGILPKPPQKPAHQAPVAGDRKPKGNVYAFERRWVVDPEQYEDVDGATMDLEPTISVNPLTKAIDITFDPIANPTSEEEEEEYMPAPEGFVIPYNQTFTLDLQGRIEPGEYAIQIYESWKKIDKYKLSEGSFAIDWKMASLREVSPRKFKTDIWDVSDRIAEEEAAKKKDTQS